MLAHAAHAIHCVTRNLVYALDDARRVLFFQARYLDRYSIVCSEVGILYGN